jgi:hypothetical protein
MAARTYNFHLPLPEELHELLRGEAQAAGQPATNLAREALADWLSQHRRARLHGEIAAFAREHAGSELDLDGDLEQAGIAVIEAEK